MNISKRFSFSAAHRLTFHSGLCKNLHGHTYYLEVQIDQDFDDMKKHHQNFVIDFGVLKDLVEKNVLQYFDHSLLVYNEDRVLLNMLKMAKEQRIDLKHYILPVESTVENMTVFISNLLIPDLRFYFRGLETLTIRLYESENSYAEHKVKIN